MKKRGHESGRQQERLYGRVWRKERKMRNRNDIVTL